MSNPDVRHKSGPEPLAGYNHLADLASTIATATAEAAASADGLVKPPHQPMSMAVIILIVVASLSLVVGAIYMLIYFKSIKPMSARSRSYADQGGKADEDTGRAKSAHPFFRRK